MLKITEKIELPSFVYDEKELREKIRYVKKETECFDKKQKVKFFFNVKANPNPHLLKIFEEEGVGAFCTNMADMLLSIKSSMKEKDIFLDASTVTEKELMVANMRSARMLASTETVLEKINAACFQIPDGICLNIEDCKEGKYFSEKEAVQKYRQYEQEGILDTGILICPEQRTTGDFIAEIKKTYEFFIDKENCSELDICVAADSMFLGEAGKYFDETGNAEENCGVNRRACESNYNGLLRHAEYLLCSDGSVKKIRRSETYDDMFVTIDFSSLPYCD